MGRCNNVTLLDPLRVLYFEYDLLKEQNISALRSPGLVLSFNFNEPRNFDVRVFGRGRRNKLQQRYTKPSRGSIL